MTLRARSLLSALSLALIVAGCASDQLASFRSVDEQRRQQVQAQAIAQEAYDLGLLRRQLTLAINLIRALGGGFDEAALSVAAAH